jgi:hypothetical protein
MLCRFAKCCRRVRVNKRNEVQGAPGRADWPHGAPIAAGRRSAMRVNFHINKIKLDIDKMKTCPKMRVKS